MDKKNIPEKIKVKRVPQRGVYDKKTIYKILDKEFLCHVAFIHNGFPVVIPTLYGRYENNLYLHGSAASRMMKSLKEGIDVSISVTRVNGLVLARSGFHHSANYESVVIFGKAIFIEDKEEKIKALKYVSDHIIPERWEEVRGPSDKELKGTMLLKILINEASAKIRTGGPKDEKDDYNLDVWAGVVPFSKEIKNPIPDELLRDGIPIPPSVEKYIKNKN